MIGEHFYEVLNNFFSAQTPKLLLMNNHEQLLIVATVQCAKNIEEILLTFLPHCSRKLRPLDVSVYVPFKKRHIITLKSWFLSNLRKVRLSIL